MENKLREDIKNLTNKYVFEYDEAENDLYSQDKLEMLFIKELETLMNTLKQQIEEILVPNMKTNGDMWYLNGICLDKKDITEVIEGLTTLIKQREREAVEGFVEYMRKKLGYADLRGIAIETDLQKYLQEREQEDE